MLHLIKWKADSLTKQGMHEESKCKVWQESGPGHLARVINVYSISKNCVIFFLDRLNHGFFGMHPEFPQKISPQFLYIDKVIHVFCEG